MALAPSGGCPNGSNCYAGRYHGGRAVYFYAGSECDRVYNGRYWVKRESDTMPLGYVRETACGYFGNDMKNGRWKFTNKAKGVNRTLVAVFSDGKYEGGYSYKAVSRSRTLNFKTGSTTLRLTMSAGTPVGGVEGNFYGKILSGRYDESGRPDGLWLMDKTKIGACRKDFELWEHGVCRESYSIDESTGERTRHDHQMPDMVMNIVNREGRSLERLVSKGSSADSHGGRRT